ncbi:MAG: hypothetical protein WCI95_03045 [bacterium]
MSKQGGFEIISSAEAFKMLEKHIQLMNKTFIYQKSNNTMQIHVNDYPYEVDLDRINSERDLLAWVLHLSEKNWTTTTLVIEFAERVAGIKGFNIHGC